MVPCPCCTSLVEADTMKRTVGGMSKHREQQGREPETGVQCVRRKWPCVIAASWAPWALGRKQG
jgi:hypothetical protein